MGVQACPLLTNIYSNQTGYNSYAYADLTSYMPEFCQQWNKLNVKFDGIYSGFISSPKQVRYVKNAIKSIKKGSEFLLVDPVLGDNGKLYPCFDQTMVTAVKELVALADYITPNLTEACMLIDEDYKIICENISNQSLISICRKLCKLGVKNVVLTGILINGEVGTFVYKSQADSAIMFKSKYIKGSYSGTGDIMASILSAGVAKGYSIKDTIELAQEFLKCSILESANNDTDPKEGVAFEPHLGVLIDGSRRLGLSN